jgi:hypothetical protein
MSGAMALKAHQNTRSIAKYRRNTSDSGFLTERSVSSITILQLS